MFLNLPLFWGVLGVFGSIVPCCNTSWLTTQQFTCFDYNVFLCFYFSFHLPVCPHFQIQGPIDRIKRVTVTVSLVTKDLPHRPHPHCLVGKDCPNGSGICVVTLNPHTNRRHRCTSHLLIFSFFSFPYTLHIIISSFPLHFTRYLFLHFATEHTCPDIMCVFFFPFWTCSFANLGIQCVRRKELDISLQKRRSQNIDPFQSKMDPNMQIVLSFFQTSIYLNIKDDTVSSVLAFRVRCDSSKNRLQV